VTRQTDLLRTVPRSRRTALAVVAAALAAATVVAFPLRDAGPVVSVAAVYALAVLLTATYWQRAGEAERRREEADLAVDAARDLLGGSSLDEALPAVACRLAGALRLPGLRVVLEPVRPGPSGDVVPLRLGRGRSGALVVPSGADPRGLDRLCERVAPALEALLRAALEREALQGEVVENAALRRSDVIKTALLRAVSHDLRTPLTAIIAAGDAVRSPALRPAERDELGAVVVEEARRLSRLVEKLLDLSRLQAGDAAPRRDWCSIEEVVRTAVDHLHEAGEQPLTELSFDRDLPLVQADAAQLERVFANLLENAHRHGGGLPVKVRARVVGGRMAVRVIDRGPGLTEQQAARAFEPFHRGEDAAVHQGSGLGLAIVRGFVEANGGRVWAESAPGQGTVFAVELPLAEVPEPTGGPA
jgi:two-component system, OmpR family, sensor histidine kinase KdpD